MCVYVCYMCIYIDADIYKIYFELEELLPIHYIYCSLLPSLVPRSSSVPCSCAQFLAVFI